MPPHGHARGNINANTNKKQQKQHNSNNTNKTKKHGVEDLDTFYANIYGERWPSLRTSMARHAPKVALWNRFCQLPSSEVLAGLKRVDERSTMQAFIPSSSSSTTTTTTTCDDHDKHHHDDEVLAKPPVDEFGVRGYYLLDYASVLIVEQLNVGAFDRVLDMCAAPGGKSIAVCQALSPDGHLTANEARRDRCARLRRNLLDHVPVNFVPWVICQRDATTWYSPSSYSRVLVDAPCSSERHLIHQHGGGVVPLREWSSQTSVELATLQRSLLLRALESCTVGGRVVYSTCSLSPMENDGVVDEALRCARCGVEVVPADVEMIMGEPTKHGRIVLPDRCNGWGPLYCCVLMKTEEHRAMSSTSSEAESDADE